MENNESITANGIETCHVYIAARSNLHQFLTQRRVIKFTRFVIYILPILNPLLKFDLHSCANKGWTNKINTIRIKKLDLIFDFLETST